MALKPDAALRKDQTTHATLEHRHFAEIARIILDFGYPQERARLAQHFAGHLQHTNPKFNRKRFMRACGLED